MTFRRSILLLALSLPVTACITSAEQRAERDNERCVARGYQPNTKDFNDCLTRLETERSVRMESNRRDMVERSAIPSLNRGQ